MEYQEAVEWLARRAKMELPSEETEQERRARIERDKALEVSKLAARFYFDNLRSPQGEPALRYILARGLSESTAVEFGMGYSADFYSMPVYLTKLGYDAKTLHNAGLITQTDDGKMLDFFGGRLIIPIINARDQVIGFGGRTLDKEKMPKYKNSSGTMLFDKRKVLFGINLIKKLQQTQKVDDIILVEGYMDVIALRQAGIKNAVASMGTALTAEQSKELRKYTNTVFVSFDGDSAGQLATWRSLDLLASAGLEVRVIKMPEGLDPDDTVKREGKDGYLKYKTEALPLIDFKIKSLASRYNLHSADGKNKFAKGALDILAPLDPIAKDLYIKEVSKISGLSVESIANSLAVRTNSPQAKPAEKAAAAAVPENNARIVSARYLLGAILDGKGFAKASDIHTDYFDLPNHKQIAEYILQCIQSSTRPIFGVLYDFVEDKAEVDLIRDAAGGIPAGGQQDYYISCIDTLQKSVLEKKRAELLEQIKNAQDAATKDLLKDELRKLLRR